MQTCFRKAVFGWNYRSLGQTSWASDTPFDSVIYTVPIESVSDSFSNNILRFFSLELFLFCFFEVDNLFSASVNILLALSFFHPVALHISPFKSIARTGWSGPWTWADHYFNLRIQHVGNSIFLRCFARWLKSWYFYFCHFRNITDWKKRKTSRNIGDYSEVNLLGLKWVGWE